MGTHRTGPESSAHGSGDADRSRLVEALRMIERLQAALKAPRETDDEPIAVVGMGCRMPGGGNGPDGFWRVLRDGVDATSEFPSDRADAHAVYDPDPDARGRAYEGWASRGEL